jgi:hypothetical protein
MADLRPRGGAVAKSASSPVTAGVVYTITRLLGGTSARALLAGTDANLSLSGASIVAAAAIAAGASQVAVVREANGQLAVEYPVTLTGAVATAPPPPSMNLAGYSIAFMRSGARQSAPLSALKA